MVGGAIESSVTCHICGQASENGKIHLATEKMFGMPGQFRYWECGSCGCLQLIDVPSDLGQYYPLGEYYSHQKADSDTNLPGSFAARVKRYLSRRRNQATVFPEGLFDLVLTKVRPNPNLAWLTKMATLADDFRKDIRILDVGC